VIESKSVQEEGMIHLWRYPKDVAADVSAL
jgi:hypothetical protein